MNFEEHLDIYLRSRFTLIVIVTLEEERALQTVQSVCDRVKRPCMSWDLADGFLPLTGWSGGVPQARDPITALEFIQKTDGDAVFILKDFHDCWSNPQSKRKLRNTAQRLKYSRKTIIVTTHSAVLPDELKDEAVIVDFSAPSASDLEEVLDRLAQTPGIKVNLTKLGREKLIQAALGLTVSQAQRVFSKAVVSDGVLDDRDIDMVTEEKKQVIRESEALEFFAAHETPDDIGGLEVLKDWLRLRERAFTAEARDYGLPSPKGIALIGISGTGKSLTAKMIGGLWRLPLLRLDVGSLFGSLLGESEERTRRALRLAETISPCVVWIDEMEKALAQGGIDSGASSRVFGTILTWMQEKTSPCFVVATVNDISSLPPELLRKGRFDEIFFLDLPTIDERKEIFAVHLKKRKRLPQNFDLERLAFESERYVGAEIEQAIVDAMYLAFNDGMREVTTNDIIHSLRLQVPLAVSHNEQVERLRDWLREGRAQSASFQKIGDAQEKFVRLRFDEE